MKKSLWIIPLLLFFVSCSIQREDKIIVSPDKLMTGHLQNINDSLFFVLKYKQTDLVSQSPFIIYYNGYPINWKIISSTEKSLKEDVKMLTGEFDEIHHCFIQTDFSLEGQTQEENKINAVLQIRMYNNVFAYRFILDQQDKKYTVEEKSPIRLAENTSQFYIPNGEKEPIGNVSLNQLKDKGYTTPIIVKHPEFCMSLHEADLHNYPMLNVRFNSEQNAMVIAPGKAVLEDRSNLPWRLVFYGRGIAELHNLKSVYVTLNEPAEGDFSWVKPGIALWDWRVKGCTFNGFKYGMNDKSLKRYIDFAVKSGLPYFLLDAEWYEDNPLKPVPNLNIQEVINYANSKGIGIFLYYDLGYVSKNNPEVDFKKVAECYSSWGAKGIKFGFLGGKGSKYTSQDKTRRTEELIRIAAKNKLMIDFHDSPIPYSGLERTYPNYINREYCHAQLDCRLAFSPGEFVKMACVNLLAGPIDQTNGTYALNEMKMRAKGPRNAYNSTVASETARFFITHTGNLSVLIDAPEAYDNKSDLFTFITAMPPHWDEARYLEMDFNSHVTVARRSNDTWFVGTVFNEKGGLHSLKLNFLNESDSYEMILFADAEDTHYINNKETYSISRQVVKKNDIVNVKVAPGGGYSILLKRK